MAFTEILYEVEDGVLTLTLNRPAKLNALTPVMLDELLEAFDRGDADDAVTGGHRDRGGPRLLRGGRPLRGRPDL